MADGENNKTRQDRQLYNLVANEKELASIEFNSGLFTAIGDGTVFDTREKSLEKLPISKLIRFICMNRDAAKHVGPDGIRIHNHLFTGELNLEHLTIRFPIEFKNCQFPKGINLTESRTQSLDFTGSTCQSFEADGLDVRGTLRMNAFNAENTIELRGAKVSGDLYLEGAHLRLNKNESDIQSSDSSDVRQNKALDLNKANIGLSLHLNKEFHANGEVNLVGINLRGHLCCEGGTFDVSAEKNKYPNNETYALVANQAKIGGNVILGEAHGQKASCVNGQIIMLEATIHGDVDCAGATFINTYGKEQHAISMDRCQIYGSVYLRNGFEATGEVRFIGANIRGSLHCDGGQFYGVVRGTEPENIHSLDLQRATIGGSLFLCKSQIKTNKSLTFVTNGLVNADGANIYTDLDCEEANFNAHECLEKIGLSCQGVTIGGAIRLINVNLHHERETTLILEDAKAERLEISKAKENGEKFKLMVRLDGFVFNSVTSKDRESITSQDALRWLRRYRPKDQLYDDYSKYYAQPYEQLAKVLRSTGDYKMARDILEAKEKDGWSYRAWQMEKQEKDGELKWVNRKLLQIWSKFYEFFAGYGYKPLRALRLVLPIFVLGWLTSLAAYRLDMMVPVETKACIAWLKGKGGESRVLAANQPHFNCLAYTLDGFLPGVDLDQEKSWRPISELLKSEEIQKPNPAAKGKPSLGSVDTNRANKANDAPPVEVCVIPDHLATSLKKPEKIILGFFVRYVWPLGILLSWFLIAVVILGPVGLIRKN
jgi:hypothetical protein